MMRLRVATVVVVGMAFVFSGCVAATTPSGISSIASALEAVGSTATGFKSTKSAAELNSASKGLVEAQTAMTETQVAQTQKDHERLAQERVVTGKLLREMSESYHEPVFITLAEWVEAGGDPDFAFKYALAHIDEGVRTQMVPQQTLSLPAQPGSKPDQSALASNPPNPPVVIRDPAPAPNGAEDQYPYFGFPIY